ncbi:MAG: response regulator [Deltaproteobacteria bacterium]|nr:response regulator [Deltaproteobacteria bacterium]
MKILIVDDSKAMRTIVMRTLRQLNLGTHTLLEATNGVEALALAKAEKPDLILADWNMPEMNGLELLKAVKAAALPVKLGLVTSECSGEMQALAKQEGAVFLLSKPFTADSMRATIGPHLT